MTVDEVSLFLALLAVLTEAGVLAGAVLAAGGRVVPTLGRARDAALAAVGPQALALAFAIAAVSMAGSLYFSEVANFTPCRLCWYQRICMYPLVPLLGIAAWRRDLAIRPYGIVLALSGLAISSYHVLLERVPSLESSSVCEVSNPCTLIWVERLGYLTIPAMALSGFAGIALLLLIARERR